MRSTGTCFGSSSHVTSQRCIVHTACSCDRGAASGCACGEGCGCGSVTLAEFKTYVRNTCPWKDCTCPEKVAVSVLATPLARLTLCTHLLQPCVCGETCGCGTVKISKEEMIKGKRLRSRRFRFDSSLSRVTSAAAIKASKATAAVSGRA